MSDGVLLIIGLIVSGVTLFGLVVMAFLIYRMHRSHARKQDTQLSQLSEDQRRLAKAMHPLVASGHPLESVITQLSFAESFDPERFAVVSQKCALDHINRMLASRAGDGASLTVETIRLLPSGVEMTFAPSRGGQLLLAEGKAVIARHGRSGRALAQLKDVRTGRIIEQMKDVPAAKTLSRLGSMSAAVVGAAHIIAGADIAKRLKQIDSKMNLMLAYRRIDQMATLERIYTSAKELGSGPMSRDKCWELWRLRGELRELRCSWRRELQHNLILINDPSSASWFKRMFTRDKTNDRAIHGSITEGQLQLGMIEYSMRLDQALAVGGGTVHEFEGTLAGELIELEAAANLLKSKAGMISGKYPDLSVESTMNGMVALVEQYKLLLPEGPQPPDNQALPTGPTEPALPPQPR